LYLWDNRYLTITIGDHEMLIKLFALLVAAGVVGTSLAIITMGGRWQQVETAAYGGERRPWWFWLFSILLLGLYAGALYSFITGDKTWAGWVLVVILPVGWALKAALVIFNKKGRQAVTSITGDQAWVKVGLARLPIAVVLVVLAFFI
jgi:hypothetical protein